MLTFPEARTQILASIVPLGVERVHFLRVRLMAAPAGSSIDVHVINPDFAMCAG